MFWHLRSGPYCGTCALYANHLATREYVVAPTKSAGIMAALKAHTPLSPAYWDTLSAAKGVSTKAIDIATYKCPKCGSEAVAETPKTRNRNGWTRNISQQRIVWLDAPAGVPEAAISGGPAAAVVV